MNLKFTQENLPGLAGEQKPTKNLKLQDGTAVSAEGRKRIYGVHFCKAHHNHKCEQCGKQFFSYKKSRFCSRECWFLWFGENGHSEDVKNNLSALKKGKPTHGKWKYKHTIHTCETCGIQFESRATHNGYTPKYCSAKCFGKTKLKDKICGHCGKIFHGKNEKFCCKKCADADKEGRLLTAAHKKALSVSKVGDLTEPQREARARMLARAATSRRRVLLINANAVSNLTKEDILSIKLKQNNKCVYSEVNPICKIDISEHYTVEHKTPIIRGGGGNIGNIDLTCKSCNCQKHTRTKEEYLLWLMKKYSSENPAIISKIQELLQKNSLEIFQNGSQNSATCPA